MITKKEVLYIEMLTQDLVESLQQVLQEYENNENYIFSSKHRAKFKRLRVELAKKLMEIQGKIY